MHEVCIEEVDELDEIEIMRESIEARCENCYMQGCEEVKVVVEIFKDVLTLEDKLKGYMADVEKDEVENRMIRNGMMQDCYGTTLDFYSLLFKGRGQSPQRLLNSSKLFSLN